MRPQYFCDSNQKWRRKTCIEDLNAQKWNGCQSYDFRDVVKICIFFKLTSKSPIELGGYLRGCANKKEIPVDKRLDCFLFTKVFF